MNWRVNFASGLLSDVVAAFELMHREYDSIVKDTMFALVLPFFQPRNRYR